LNKRKIVKEVLIFFDNAKTEIHNISKKIDSGGEIRAKNGDIWEHLSIKIFNLVAKELNNGFKAVKGDNSLINGHQVDVHCFNNNNKLILIQECKSYLDLAYAKRTISDFETIQNSIGYGIPSIVLAGEDSVKKESLENLKKSDIIDEIFYLVDGKRNSKKPWWKIEFDKPINSISLAKYIDFIIKIQLEGISQTKLMKPNILLNFEEHPEFFNIFEKKFNIFEFNNLKLTNQQMLILINMEIENKVIRCFLKEHLKNETDIYLNKKKD
jgi:hypothetical protein